MLLGLFSSYDAWASHCCGLSCCRGWALGLKGFSSCDSQTLEHRLNSCGSRAYLLCSMWDLPRPGIEPMSPALAGRSFTTEPPGKPCLFVCNIYLGFPGGSAGKESACNLGDLSSIPGLGRSLGEEKDYPLQYSGLENSTVAKSTVHGVTKSQTHLSTHTLCFQWDFSCSSLDLPSSLQHPDL